MHKEKVIEVKGVSRNYEHKESIHALSDVSFSVSEGEFVSIVGPSGCGKTTLLKLLGNLLEPDSGEISIRKGGDEDAGSRRIGFVFQDPVLFPWLTVLENVELPLQILDCKQQANSSMELLKLVGLEGFEYLHPWRLSRGMRGRASIAQALSYDPEVLLMDEPFSGLDEITRNQMDVELLRVWMSDATRISTIVFVTHSIPEAVFLSDRIIVLSERPGSVKAVIENNLGRPRTQDTLSSPEYFSLVNDVRGKLL